MLNKKMLFHVIYGVALVGAVMSCVGILNEFLNIIPLHDVNIVSVRNLTDKIYSTLFWFYLAAFVISAGAVIPLVLSLLGVIKIKEKVCRGILLASCVVLIVMSFCFFPILRYRSMYGIQWNFRHYDYLHYYTFRSAVMSFATNIGVVFVCRVIDAKVKKAENPSGQ